MSFVLALDQGTTSCRAILYREDGSVHAVAQREFAQIYPRPGWVEHDPEEIWSTQISVAVEALGRAHARPRDVAALGITDQRETTVVWDRETGKPVYNAIVWQDRRTADACKKLTERGLDQSVREKTGLVIDPYFSATKIAWILENVSGARERARAGQLAFGTIDSWLIWNLTSGVRHCTDISNASRTMLFNIRERRWDADLLAALDIPEQMLPEVLPSSGDFGRVSTTLGLGDVAIAGVAGDQQAALFGQACFRPGMAKCTYGTGAFLLQNTGETARASQNQLLTTVAWQRDQKVEYALEGSVFVAGSVVQWLRDGLGLIRSSAEVEQLAASVPDTNDVYIVPAFTGLGAPHWDPHARGSISGITRGTTAGHIARAALESIAYQCADLLTAMQEDAGVPIEQLRVDGGAAANDLLMQFQADLLRIPIVRPSIIETTAMGAAYLAGLATGFWKSMDEIESHWKTDKIFTPQRPASEMNAFQGRWREALDRAKGWSRPSGAAR